MAGVAWRNPGKSEEPNSFKGKDPFKQKFSGDMMLLFKICRWFFLRSFLGGNSPEGFVIDLMLQTLCCKRFGMWKGHLHQVDMWHEFALDCKSNWFGLQSISGSWFDYAFLWFFASFTRLWPGFLQHLTSSKDMSSWGLWCRPILPILYLASPRQRCTRNPRVFLYVTSCWNQGGSL